MTVSAWCSTVFTPGDTGLLDIIGWDKLGQSYVDERATPCDSLHEHDPHTYIVHSWCELHWRASVRPGRSGIEY